MLTTIRPARALQGLGVLVACLFLLIPLVTLLGEPLGEMGRVWDRAMDSEGLWPALRNSFLLAVGSVSITVVVGTALAWCTLQLPPGRWSTVASLISVCPLTLPSIAGFIGWIFIFSPRVGYGNTLLRSVLGLGGNEGPVNIYSLPAIVLVTAVHLVPFVYLFVLSALRNLDVGLEDAARVSGAGWARVQWSIVLRAIRPALLYGSVVVLLLGLGQFTGPLLLGNKQVDVLTTLMFFETQRVPPDYSYAAFLAVPLVLTAVALVYLQGRMVGSVGRYVTVGKGSARARKRRRWPIIPVVLFGAFTVLPPLAGLVIVALSDFWTKDLSWSALDVGNLTASLSEPAIRSALGNTLRFAATGVVIVVVASLWLASYLQRATGWTKRILDYVVNLPLSVPAIIFGMGIFLAYALGPFKLYGSSILFVVAYVIIALPHGVRIVAGGLAQIGRTPQSAARVCGSGPIRSLVSILLPLMRGSLAGAAILGFIIMTQEFSAAALLRSSSTHVLATSLYERFEFGGYPGVAAIALAMVGLSLAGVGLILALGGKSALEQ